MDIKVGAILSTLFSVKQLQQQPHQPSIFNFNPKETNNRGEGESEEEEEEGEGERKTRQRIE
uniref:Uncharacterized protein n=1 Tax=Tetranychus urticae TaxID=32264 RepID=T1KBW4_TETUR